MKKIFSITVLATLLFAGCCNDCGKSRVIKTAVPERPAGQADMVAYAAPAIDTVRVGFIGLGMRGPGAVERFIHIPGTKIVALCDLLPENVAKCQKMLEKAGLPAAAEYTDAEDAWKELCERDDIDLVYIATTGSTMPGWAYTPWNRASTPPSKCRRP